MAHFARIENNIVTEVITVHNNVLLDENGNEQESLGIDFCQTLYGDATNWRQTSYNGNFRKNFAAIGYKYDTARHAFIAPKPFDSWVLNDTTCCWDPPTPYPGDEDTHYRWDESTTSWVQIN